MVQSQLAIQAPVEVLAPQLDLTDVLAKTADSHNSRDRICGSRAIVRKKIPILGSPRLVALG